MTQPYTLDTLKSYIHCIRDNKKKEEQLALARQLYVALMELQELRRAIEKEAYESLAENLPKPKEEV